MTVLTDAPVTVQAPPAAHPGHPDRWRALPVLCLSLVAVVVDNTVLNTALPSIARTLHATVSDLQWITDAYTLAFAALMLTAGAIGTRVGLRRALVAGLLVFAGGSAAAALCSSSGQLIVARTVMGLGAAFVMPASVSMVVALFPVEERPKALGAWSASAGVGVVIGPVLGGALLEHFSWGSAFWVNLPIVVVALFGIATLVPSVPVPPRRPLDLPGLALSVTGLALVVDAVVEAPHRGWFSAATLGELSGGAAVLAAFVGWELHSAKPMLDVRMFRSPRFSVAALSLGLTFFALFGGLFAFTQFLQLVHGYSPLRAGLGAMPFAGAMAATSGVSPLVAARLGARGSVTLGLLVVAGGFGWLTMTTLGTGFPVLTGALGVVGAGMGLVMAPASESVVGSVPLVQAPMANAVSTVVRELGGVLGIAVVGSVVASSYRHRGHGRRNLVPHLHDAAFTSAMTVGMLACAVAALFGATAALVWLPRRATR